MIPRILPSNINRLDELANNLWWSWHEEARRLFRSLDYPLWKLSEHNPVKMMREITDEILNAAANDPVFLGLYDSVIKSFDADMSADSNCLKRADGEIERNPVAYFSMEFAFHNSLPIYAGGLGILAGDICKEASDMALPMVAVGFMYPQGYFRQHISREGWQEEIYRQLNFDEAPITRVLSAKGEKVITTVQLGNATLGIGVWQVKVGRTNVYLMDTNLESNPDPLRQLSARLYVADREHRLRQEIILGIGGVRVLRALNIEPAIWHANEGHTAFMMLERIREKVAGGAAFKDALSAVQSNSVFTTHTPVMAGHDIFTLQLIEKYFSDYLRLLDVNPEAFIQLGRQDGNSDPSFNMTAFALRSVNHRFAVSAPHETVTRKMWHVIWPDVPEDKVPISHITNGIHVPSWMAPEINGLLEKHLGHDWLKDVDNPAMWEAVSTIPNVEFWEVHQLLKRKLIAGMREDGRSHWIENGDISAKQVITDGVFFDNDVLTIGFGRRFTEYKRPMLLFRDFERLKRILNNKWQPVQIVFSGKSHPDDIPSKQLLQQVCNLAASHDLQGKIAFVEDYDMHKARILVQGVDVWLNTPRRLQEASGTSGMKASINGVLHLSVPDGWWIEGYNGANGWTITSDFGPPPTGSAEDEWDSKSLYQLIEEEVAPLYYTRDRNGVPNGWIRMVKEAMRSISPVFSARRMLKQYISEMYDKSLTSTALK
jgi:glycogen phosphorylase